MGGSRDSKYFFTFAPSFFFLISVSRSSYFHSVVCLNRQVHNSLGVRLHLRLCQYILPLRSDLRNTHVALSKHTHFALLFSRAFFAYRIREPLKHHPIALGTCNNI